MCGRYAASRRPEDLVEEFELRGAPVAADTAGLERSWNVAPTDPAPLVLERAPRHEPGAPPERRLLAARWGLVPSWAKDASGGARLINARVETVADKPSFRRAFAARRALVPADGYYEWYASSEALGPAGKPLKQPFFIHPRAGGVLAMAGLYELWRDPVAAAAGAVDPWLWSFTVITTHATDALGRIHDRMPMLVERERWSAWLDPAQHDAGQLLGLLVPAAPGLLAAQPVSTEVNSVRNDGAHLVDPLPFDDVPADVRDGVTP